MSSPEPTVRIAATLRRECVAVGAAPADKEAALREVARLAAQSTALAGISEAAIFTALKEREALGTTGFGDGIAIPHCRLDTVREFVIGLVTVPQGVEFAALDGKPVKLIVFIIAPSAGVSAHIRLLSALSQALVIPCAVSEILSAETADKACEYLLGYVREGDEPRNYRDKNLFHVFVQEEPLFREVLQVFIALGAHSVAVMEAENPAAYLARMPVFAGFWRDEQSDFSRVIVAALAKKLTNEALRRIERIVGPLAESRRLLVTVQELSFTAGALDI